MNTVPSNRRITTVLRVCLCMLAMPALVQAGRTVNVSTSSGLQNAVLGAQAGDEIILAPGTYYPTAYLTINAASVTIRGSTGNPNDVIVQGPGTDVSTAVNKEGFQIYKDDVTIKDLTVCEYFYHAIHMMSNTNRSHVLNVIARNNGEQQIKGAAYNTDGSVENTLCELTHLRANLPGDPRGNDYVGGIDLHGGRNFLIRDCIVRNIQGAGGDSDGAIFAWDGSSNITVERCVVLGCNRGICFGNNSGGRNGYDVDGGIARNNFVWARTTPRPGSTTTPWLYDADSAIDVYACRNGKIYNNTVWTDDGNYGRTIRVGAGGSVSNSNVQFMYNIVRGVYQVSTGSNYTTTGDITGNVAQATWFVDPANANFHLTKLAVAAIDHAVLLPADVPQDFDSQTRPVGSLPDVGADEFLAADLTGDGHVDTVDLLILAGTWAKSTGQPGYNAKADLNADNTVDVVDLLTLAGSWGL